MTTHTKVHMSMYMSETACLHAYTGREVMIAIPLFQQISVNFRPGVHFAVWKHRKRPAYDRVMSPSRALTSPSSSSS